MLRFVLLVIFVLAGLGQAYADIQIHFVADDQDLIVTILDENNNNNKVVDMQPVKNGGLITPTLTTDKSLQGHIKWFAVTHKDANGQCLWGHNDVPNLNDFDEVHASATSSAPINDPPLPCN